MVKKNLHQRIGGLPLHSKILIPFFLIFLILGVVATFGTHLLIRQALTQTADQRLLAIQELVYREIKKQELLLVAYANMIEFQQCALESEQTVPRMAILQDTLLTLLANAKVTATIYPAETAEQLGLDSLHDLFKHSMASGKPRFRLTNGTGTTPNLSVAVPLAGKRGKLDSILLLQTPIDTPFLKQIVAPFKTDALLFTLDQQPLVASSDNFQLPSLSDQSIEKISKGERIIQTVNDASSSRQLYTAVPLGKSDLVLLAIKLPLTDLNLLLRTLATRAGLTILAALAFGCWFYYHLVRQIMAPLKELITATKEVGKGNLNHRITTTAQGEIGQLAGSLNLMLGQLDNLYEQKATQEKDLALAKENLRFKEILEQKNLEIERTNRELKTHLREISLLFQLNQMMSSTLELNVMFDRTLGLLRDILNCTDVILFLYNQGSDELEIKKSLGHDIEKYAGLKFRLTEGITGLAARSRELLYVRDIAKDERYLSYKGKILSRGSMVSAPILVKNRLVGVLNLHKAQIDGFSDTELKMIQATTNQLAVAIENVQLYEQTKNLSNTDELTNLANRRYFQEILRREFVHAGRYRSNFSLIMIDIDHFKRYNDMYGHLNGDVVLRRVASLFLQTTRGIDLVARFGGEEFVILLPKTTREGAFAAAEKLRTCVENEIFQITNDETISTSVTISLGIAEYPNDSKDMYELLNLADRALYLAKEQGRNRTVVWDEKLFVKTVSQTNNAFKSDV